MLRRYKVSAYRIYGATTTTRANTFSPVDLVLYRYGSTGVQEVLEKAVEMLGVVPVFPVKNLTTFGSAR